MRKLLWPLAVAAIGGSVWSSGSDSVVVMIGGDQDGYLSPCGCAKPMTGGIERKVALVLAQGNAEQVVYIETGGLVADSDRQAELKIDALAEAYKLAGVDAVGLGAPEARLGSGAIESLRRLSGGALTTASLQPSATNAIEPYRIAGPFLVGSAAVDPSPSAVSLGEQAVPLNSAIGQLLSSAEQQGKAPILMLRGDAAQAKASAERFPSLALVVYSSKSQPAEEPFAVGDTWVVSPGHKGRFVLRLEWDNGFKDYKAIALTPEVPDDPHAGEILRRYLGRVTDEKLLEQMPRLPGPQFAGNKMCGSCHADAQSVWSESAHAGALETLEENHHDRDPECVGCHVVGLESVRGFKSRSETPDLTDVGCESCHGAGRAHAMRPMQSKMPAVGEASCSGCHNLDHSPQFDFDTYWPKIEH